MADIIEAFSGMIPRPQAERTERIQPVLRMRMLPPGTPLNLRQQQCRVSPVTLKTHLILLSQQSPQSQKLLRAFLEECFLFRHFLFV